MFLTPHVFLDGPGASGETLVYNALITVLVCLGVTVKASAYT